MLGLREPIGAEDEALGRLRSMASGDDEYTRLLAWSILEGRDPAAFHGRSPALDAVMATDPEGSRELRLAVAAAMVQTLGTRLFGGYALTAAGLDATDLDDLQVLVAAAADDQVGRASTVAEAAG